MAPAALPLWLADPDWLAFCARSAERPGAPLTHRPVSETLSDILEWERELGLDRVRRSRISTDRESELVMKLTG